MNIYSMLMVIFMLIGAIILFLYIFGVFDLIFKKNTPVPPAPGKVTASPLIRGDGGAPKKSTPKAEVPKGPKVYKRNVPATRISKKKVAFLSGTGDTLRSKFKLTEDGRAAIQRGGTVFVRELAAQS